MIYSLAADGVLGAAAFPLSPVLTPALPLASLTILPPWSPPPVASPIVQSTPAAAAPETTSATGGGDSTLDSPSEPDLDPEAEPDGEAEADGESEEEKAKRLMYCSLCKVAVNSALQLEAHNTGERRLSSGSIRHDYEIFGQKTKDFRSRQTRFRKRWWFC